MSRNRRLIGLTALGIVVALLAWPVGPRPPRLGGTTTGDATLAATVRAALADPTGYRGLAVALIESDTVRLAGLGDRGDGTAVEPDTAFEVGSVGKALTGMLLADLAADGTVDPDEPLRDLLPDLDLTDHDLAATTAAELASHRSGLPSVRLTGVGPTLGTYLRDLAGRDPYAGQDVDWLRSTLADASVDAGAHPVSYSNYGMAALGHALSERAGMPYPDLLRRRILDPLGMRHTTFHLDGAPPPERGAHGGTGGGRRTAPWQSSGYAPAGAGLWSTAGDLATLVSATLGGTAPGADAARPRFDETDSRRVGYGWFTDRLDGREVTWHNGGTGGFRSFVGFDRAAGRGVVVLSNTDREVDTLGRHLLAAGADAVDGGAAVDGDGPDWRAVLRTLVLSLIGGLGLLFVATRTVVDRLRLVTNGAWALALPALACPTGAWWAVPTWVWAAGAGLSGAAVAVAARRWPAAPVLVGRFRWPRWVGTVLGALAAPAAVIWVLT